MAVHATPGVHTAVGVVAALLAGVPAVPVNPKLGVRELDHVVGDAAPELVLAAPGVALPGALAGLDRIDVELHPGRPDRAGSERGAAPPDAPALVIYTSGTTGPPKGAVLSRAAIASNLDALAEAWEWTRDDLLAHALPLFHVHGLVLGILGPLRRGGTVHHLGALDAAALAAAGADLVFGVPTQYHRLADQLESDPESAAAIGRARLLVSGSAALTAVDHARLRRQHRAGGAGALRPHRDPDPDRGPGRRRARAGHRRAAAARHRGAARRAAGLVRLGGRSRRGRGARARRCSTAT